MNRLQRVVGILIHEDHCTPGLLPKYKCATNKRKVHRSSSTFKEKYGSRQTISCTHIHALSVFSFHSQFCIVSFQSFLFCLAEAFAVCLFLFFQVSLLQIFFQLYTVCQPEFMSPPITNGIIRLEVEPKLVKTIIEKIHY